ncbi:hypothetical protein VNO80_05113 [Phaseolus coccineus]|uniref:X8 domain-containing protein n=1 Tax=Phaseolus coccineus TaxID=3886 RepID=A0AAN9NUL7_PHACN
MGMVVAVTVTVTVTVTAMVMEMVGGGSWCVAKIGVSEEALQRALDSACGGDGGADCTPIQPNGLCFTPNTLQAHASYAFNSFYQRNARASNACLFNGASTVAQTDPSYGSCVYPSSSAVATPTASTAEVTNTTVPTSSSTTTTPIHGRDGAGMNPQIPQNSTRTSNTMNSFLLFLLILFLVDTFFLAL